MTDGLAKTPDKSRRRGWLLVALIFAVQLGLILCLGNYSPPRIRAASPAPIFRLASPAAAEWLALNDPTLFALPHAQGFSGIAWLNRAPNTNSPLVSYWSAPPPGLLPLPLGQLGVAFNHSVQPAGLEAVLPAAPELTLPELASEAIGPGPSAFRIEGELASRRLLTPLTLQAWPSLELLTNSVVQLVVDGRGRPISVALLSRSGSQAADNRALELAAAARFSAVSTGESRTGNLTGPLTWGRMVIEWQTVPLPPTNAPAGPRESAAPKG